MHARGARTGQAGGRNTDLSGHARYEAVRSASMLCRKTLDLGVCGVMKRAIISGLVAVLLVACEDREQPTGPSGDESLGQIFEIDNVFFEYDSELGFWSAAIGIPSHIVVYESDAILAYRFFDSVPDGDGGEADAWEMLPNVYFLDAGTIQYVFNHTFFDVELIIDGNYDLRNLATRFTDDQLFRFVVAPAAFVTQSGVDIADYEAVVKALEIVGDYRLK